MKTCLVVICLFAMSIAVHAAPPLAAPIHARPPKKPAPPPPVYRETAQGVVPRAVRGGNPLQMLNPKAPAKYGTWAESTSFDPNIPGKWKGIKLFEWIF
jgi:hypothetical protein